MTSSVFYQKKNQDERDLASKIEKIRRWEANKRDGIVRKYGLETTMAKRTVKIDPERPPTTILAPWEVHLFWQSFGPSTLGTVCCSSGKSVKLTVLREIG